MSKIAAGERLAAIDAKLEILLKDREEARHSRGRIYARVDDLGHQMVQHGLRLGAVEAKQSSQESVLSTLITERFERIGGEKLTEKWKQRLGGIITKGRLMVVGAVGAGGSLWHYWDELMEWLHVRP